MHDTDTPEQEAHPGVKKTSNSDLGRCPNTALIATVRAFIGAESRLFADKGTNDGELGSGFLYFR